MSADLVAAAVPVIRRLAQGVMTVIDSGQPDGGDELIRLAAHLFAIASQLEAEAPSPGFSEKDSDLGAPPTSLKGTLAQLANLSHHQSPHRLYWILVSSLGAIDGLFQQKSNEAALPRRTQIEPLRYGGGREMAGSVFHWLRASSELSALRATRNGDKASRIPKDRAHHRHLRFLGMYLDSDSRPPCFIPPRPFSHQLVRAIYPEESSFRIALCPLPADSFALFEIHERYGPAEFVACDYLEKGLDAHFDHLISAVHADRVNLLVMPELCVAPHHRTWLAEKVSKTDAAAHLSGVLAGSYHVGRGDEPDRPRNEAVLVDTAGEPFLTHHKRGRFTLTKSQVENAPDRFPKKPPTLQATIHEGIAGGSALEILDTPLGRLAVLICADAIDPEDKGYLGLLRSLRPDLVFVVSMTFETGLFTTFMAEMSRAQIGTMFVNARSAWKRGAEPDLAAFDLALHQPKDAPPMRVRWRATGGPDAQPQHRIEKFDFRAHEWIALGSPEEGVSWLGGSPDLGMVVDFGPHFRFKATAGAK